MIQPIVLVVSGPTRAYDYTFVQAQGANSSMRFTSDARPLFALPGGGIATEETILDHLQAKRGYRPRARIKE